MIRQSKNIVKIEGILSEIDLKEIKYTSAGEEKEAIAGTVSVLVEQFVNKTDEKPIEMEIPVHVFAVKVTRTGAINPAYTSAKKVMDDFISIAAAGSKEDADRIRITSGSITMNEYYTPTERLVSFPRIQASFIDKVKARDMNSYATFEAEIYIGKIVDEVNRDGEETGRVIVNGIIVQYGERADLVPFVIERKDIITGFKDLYEVGQTVPVSGNLNFTSKTIVQKIESELGDDVEESRTINISDLLIQGVRRARDEEFAYQREDIVRLLKDREARLEKEKEKRKNQEAEKAAPAAGLDELSLGF